MSYTPDAMIEPVLSAADPIMAALVAEGLLNSVIPDTQSSYNTATKRFVEFCKARGLQPWPVRSHMITTMDLESTYGHICTTFWVKKCSTFLGEMYHIL